jgi:hypothetical protein
MRAGLDAHDHGADVRNGSAIDYSYPTNVLSGKLARDMMRACNSVYAVMGVVEPKRRPPPDAPNLETRELETQRAMQRDGEPPRSLNWRKYVSCVLTDLSTSWLVGTHFRLIAWPARSRMSILQQASVDAGTMSAAAFFFPGLAASFLLHVLDDEVLRARLRYLLERMVLASVSSSYGRSFWLSCLPYIEPS